MSKAASPIHRTFHPKYATYTGDGNGRDHYILFNNGGLSQLRDYRGSMRSSFNLSPHLLANSSSVTAKKRACCLRLRAGWDWQRLIRDQGQRTEKKLPVPAQSLWDQPAYNGLNAGHGHETDLKKRALWLYHVRKLAFSSPSPRSGKNSSGLAPEYQTPMRES